MILSASVSVSGSVVDCCWTRERSLSSSRSRSSSSWLRSFGGRRPRSLRAASLFDFETKEFVGCGEEGRGMSSFEDKFLRNDLEGL
jgi:hypothetical protein